MNFDQFLVNKNDFSQTSVVSQLAETAEQSLKKGEVLLKVDRFALTANNITYALVGDALRYWEFFPAKSGWGIIPAWGFAEVVVSDNDQLKIGDRYYGYYPMATYLGVKPQQISASSFVDGANHRQSLSKIYNQYVCCANDPLYRQETEALQMLFRPLFSTSFLLEDFLCGQDLFGARQLVLSSASSKTALGTAFSLYHNRSKRQLDYRIIGLTSPGNLEFVKGLGCYDDVFSYDQVAELAGKTAAAIVDFAGNSSLLKQLHLHFGDQLKYSCLVGVAHWDKRDGSMMDLPGVPPETFFAPSQGEKRITEWGNETFQQMLAEAWSRFVEFVNDWVRIERGNGPAEIERLYQNALAGHINPKTGIILSFWND